MKLSEYIEKFGDKQVDVDKLSEFIIEDKVWLPKNGQIYWYVNDLGETRSFTYSNDSIDEAITSLQQVYRTEVEAEFARDKAIFLEFMRKEFLRNSDVIDWKDEHQTKHYLWYDHYSDRVAYWCTNGHQITDIQTTSEKWLKEFIDDHYDDIKKYYFEVKED